MTDIRIIEEMAKLDGVIDDQRSIYPQFLPAYLKDHNAVQRLINEMDEKTLSRYWAELGKILEIGCDELEWDGGCRFAQATCRQKCEAILKLKESK